MLNFLFSVERKNLTKIYSDTDNFASGLAPPLYVCLALSHTNRINLTYFFKTFLQESKLFVSLTTQNCPTGTNIAFRKPANQSTSVRGGSAANANDGERSTEHDGRRCSETQKEASPWWQVDLLKPYAIKVVRVTTRGCCGHQPLQDLEIRVGNSSTDLQRNPLCAWFPGTIGE